MKINADDLVQIQELMSAENGKLYLMKIADIHIRAYLTLTEATRVSDYMKKIVSAVINSTETNLVNIQTLTTEEDFIYLMTIAGVPLRTFIDGYEAEVMENFMETVVTAIKEKSG